MRVQSVFLHGLYLVLIGSLAVSCASQPTRVEEGRERRLESSTLGASGEPATVTIDEKTIVVDARSAFDFTLAHIPRAVPLSWTDFTQSDEAVRGVLQKDLFSLAARLARIGITPESKVVVVGRGVSGEGEEGRIAWTLAYLGVRDVHAVPMSYFKGTLTSQKDPPPRPLPLWKPTPQRDLLVTKEEILNVINKGGVHKPIVFQDEGVLRQYRIIDVRTPREYLGKEGFGLKHRIPNMDAINIAWQEFFDESGRPNPAIREQLRELGFEDHHRVIVISERGLRSAAVTMALKELGVPDVGNYAGGLRDLLR